MKKWFRYFWVLAVLVAFLGCSSLKKKAQESLEAGSYDRAMQLFEQYLRKNPDDSEALQGLKDARHGWIDKKLISVRMARLAGNQQQALDLLLEALNKEQNWKFLP